MIEREGDVGDTQITDHQPLPRGRVAYFVLERLERRALGPQLASPGTGVETQLPGHIRHPGRTHQQERPQEVPPLFDRGEFTTTLLLQVPEAGGAFESRTDLRSAEDPNHTGGARRRRGKDPELKSLQVSPGTRNVFRGKNTDHRVTQVQGPRERVISVFSFYDRPGGRFTKDEQRGFYGRAA